MRAMIPSTSCLLKASLKRSITSRVVVVSAVWVMADLLTVELAISIRALEESHNGLPAAQRINGWLECRVVSAERGVREESPQEALTRSRAAISPGESV